MKKSICFIIPTLQVGGMERVMSELVNYFGSQPDLEVQLVLYGRTPEIFYDVPDSVRVHRPLEIYNDRLRFFSTLGRLFFLRKTVKKINPESVLSFGEYWNSFVLIALYGLSYRVYISDRCSPEKDLGRFHTLLRKWLYPHAKGIIAQTETAKKIYERQFRHSRIEVIGNPIPNIGHGLFNKENTVLTVGRLIKSKNHDRLIELFCEIARPGWKLVVVGGDAIKQENMSRLSKLISSLDAGDRVILIGYQKNVKELYQRVKIFTFTSVSEGFPNAIGEAMSAGLPVVAFDCIAGPSEMIENEVNGFLVPVNDYDTFRQRLEQLMSDEALRELFGLRAMESIGKYSAEKVCNKYYNFIFEK